VKPVNNKFRLFFKGKQLTVGVIQSEPPERTMRERVCVQYDGSRQVHHARRSSLFEIRIMRSEGLIQFVSVVTLEGRIRAY
jgi:hypothetical protein